MTFLLFFIIFSSCFVTSTILLSKLKIIRFKSRAQNNVDFINNMNVEDSSVESFLTKDDFLSRLTKIFNQNVDKFVIDKKVKSKQDILAKNIYKIYGAKKTYASWEYERTLVSLIAFIAITFIAILFKLYIIIPVGICISILFYLSYESSLTSACKTKDWENFIMLPDILMTICMLYKIGAINNVFQGLRKISKTYPSHRLITEIDIMLKEIDYNKDKYEALEDLSKRVDLKDFTSFTNLVIESEQNNIPVVDTLTSFAFNISNKRKILANNKINSLPEKMSIVLLLVAAPMCIIYMVLPAMIMAFEQMKDIGAF